MVSERAARLIGFVGRIAAALAVVAAVAPTPFAPTAPARADEPIVFVSTDPDALLQGGDPDERLQIVIKSVNVSNDRDGFWTGAGDILLMASFWRCSGPQPPCSASDDNQATLLAYARKSFNADSGDLEILNRLMPLAGDVRDGAASEEAGIAVHAGTDYLFEIDAFERDFSGGDFMGGIQRKLNQSNNWGIGLHSLEPADHFADTSLPPTEDSLLCAGCGGIIVGDYLVTYEIRKTALPDLHPKAIKVIDGATGSDDAVCVDVENRGQQDSASFYLTLYVDNSMPPNGSLEAAGLGPGESRESCIRTTLPTSGLHRLRAIVDQYRSVAEMDENNNAIERGLNRTPLGQTRPDDLPEAVAQDTGPEPSPGTPPFTRIIDPVIISDTATIGTGPAAPILTAPAPSPNLEIKAIRVKGNEPSGNNDCDPGQNDVTVVVKNEGNAAAANFLVRLVVGNQTKEKSATNLASGSEVNVSFDDLMLTKGQHKLTATANQTPAAAATNEDDGKLEVTVGCADE